MLITISMQSYYKVFGTRIQRAFLKTCFTSKILALVFQYPIFSQSKFVPGSTSMTSFHFYLPGIPLSSIFTSKKICLEFGFIASKVVFFKTLILIYLKWLCMLKRAWWWLCGGAVKFYKAQLESLSQSHLSCSLSRTIYWIDSTPHFSKITVNLICLGELIIWM